MLLFVSVAVVAARALAPRTPEHALTCTSLGRTCGKLETPSGAAIYCGTCSEREVCGEDGIDNVCCTPTTCAEQHATCGTMSDGCGGTLDCGACADGEVCGGAGAPNVCGRGTCVASTCEELDLQCGTASDGCGGTLECGSCPERQLCGGDGVANRCGFPTAEPPRELVRACFGQPQTDFSPLSHASTHVGLWAGEPAVDFALADADGQVHHLRELLATKPVLLELGSVTCGQFQANHAKMNDLARRYGDRLHVVTVYTVDAHPSFPDPSPYRGRAFTLGYSRFRQPRTLAERRFLANRTPPSDPRRLVLVDELDDPVWCTYGPAPNAAFLIRQDGVIEAAHAWLETESMERSIQVLLARQPPAPSTPSSLSGAEGAHATPDTVSGPLPKKTGALDAEPPRVAGGARRGSAAPGR